MEQSQWPTGAIFVCHGQLGRKVAASRDLHHSEWTRVGPARKRAAWMSRRRQEWTASRRFGNRGQTAINERTCCRAPCWNLLPWQTSAPSVTHRKGPRSERRLGVIQAGWWAQEVANKAGASEHPFCLKCEPAFVGTAKHRLRACPAYRETRFHLPPTHQHQGETATNDKVKWERGLTHDPGEKHIPGRRHDGTLHVWVHPSVVGNRVGGKLYVDGSLMCKHGAQGGQTGWAVAQVNELTHELVCSAHGAMPISLPVQRRTMRAELWALLQAIILSEPGATFISDWAAVLRGLERGQKRCSAEGDRMLMCGDESWNVSETSVKKHTSTL